eukprot:898628-Rhodomonas_salina.1
MQLSLTVCAGAALPPRNTLAFSVEVDAAPASPAAAFELSTTGSAPIAPVRVEAAEGPILGVTAGEDAALAALLFVLPAKAAV